MTQLPIVDLTALPFLVARSLVWNADDCWYTKPYTTVRAHGIKFWVISPPPF